MSVRYHSRGGEGEAVRRALWRPYDQQADEERAAARRRAPRAGAPDEGPEAPAGDVVTPG